MTGTVRTESKKPRRWYTVFALSAAAFVDSSENQTLSILWPMMYPVLKLKISLLGPILGISGLVGVFTQPLWGWMADRFSRRKLLIWITGVWGMWTLAVGLVNSFEQLLIVRILSSLGLGVLWPAAFSLLSDLFERRDRGRAAGVMTAISFLGTLAAYMILPVIGALNVQAWRYGFYLMGIISVFTGFLFFFINDPPRGSGEEEIQDVVSEESAARYAFRLADLPALAKIPTWWVMLLQQTIDNIPLTVLYGWAFTWLDSLGLGDGGFIVVIVLMLGTLSGHLFFGWLGDLLEARYQRYGRTMMAQVGLAVSLPALTLFIALGDGGVLPLIIFGMLSGLGLSSVDTGARWPITQAVLRPELRASGRASLDMVQGAIGALAMALTGKIIDYFDGNITTMLLLMIPLPKLISTLTWMLVFKTYPKDRSALHDFLLKRREEISKNKNILNP